MAARLASCCGPERTTRTFDTNHGVPVIGNGGGQFAGKSSRYSPRPRPRRSMTRCAPASTVWACRAVVQCDQGQLAGSCRNPHHALCLVGRYLRKEMEVTGEPAPLAQRLLTMQVWNESGQLAEVIRTAADLSLPAAQDPLYLRCLEQSSRDRNRSDQRSGQSGDHDVSGVMAWICRPVKRVRADWSRAGCGMTSAALKQETPRRRSRDHATVSVLCR